MMPMIFVMVAIGISEEPFPLTATRGIVKRAGLYQSLGKGATNYITWAAHLMYGATFGALFGVLKGRTSLSTFPAAPLFGMMTYAVGFLGWLPLLGIVPPLWRQRQPAGVMRLMGHLMYGAVTGAVYDRTASVARQLVSPTAAPAPAEARRGRERVAA